MVIVQKGDTKKYIYKSVKSTIYLKGMLGYHGRLEALYDPLKWLLWALVEREEKAKWGSGLRSQDLNLSPFPSHSYLFSSYWLPYQTAS